MYLTNWKYWSSWLSLTMSLATCSLFHQSRRHNTVYMHKDDHHNISRLIILAPFHCHITFKSTRSHITLSTSRSNYQLELIPQTHVLLKQCPRSLDIDHSYNWFLANNWNWVTIYPFSHNGYILKGLGSRFTLASMHAELILTPCPKVCYNFTPKIISLIVPYISTPVALSYSINKGGTFIILKVYYDYICTCM